MAKKVEVRLLRATVLAGGVIGMPNEKRDIDADFAADLVRRGRAELTAPAVAAGADGDDALLDAVESAIRNLRPADFGPNGKPDLGAIKKLLPEDAKKITAALRDEVWDDLIEEGFEAPAAQG